MVPHERIIGLYEDTAAQWDAARSHGPTPQEQVHLTSFAEALPPRATVLDIGCGSGVPVARDLIARGLEVTGIDSSPSLIALCRERFPQADWQVADMRGLDLKRRFAGILAWYSFFHLAPDDQRSMFPVFARHAAPGALLTFTSGPIEGVKMGEWAGEPLYHASLAPEQYCHMLAANGFTLLRYTAGMPVVGDGPSVWLARKE